MLRLIFALLLLVPALAGAQALENIRKTGVVKLGYIDNAAPFSSTGAGGEPQGYSVDLCRAVAASLAAQLKREVKPQWVKLTIQDRIEAVRGRKVDLECSTTTWTLSRQQLVDFSLVTFVDGGNLLVKAGAQLARLQDFPGKRIAAIQGTTTDKALRAALQRAGVQAEIVPIKARNEGIGLLEEGKVDALASDRTTLIGLVLAGKSPGAYRLLDQDFSIEQYALMLPRGEHDFRLAVNRALAGVYRSGEIEKIYQRWLGPLGPPSLLLSATYFIQNLAE
ncbi:MAG TPA: amino acid ABC transporter substrate-binding protein [Burkholderiales bacterium]|nr:amino acid ABC transporter substrate-binding protein [Burkholderiales bacterium]